MIELVLLDNTILSNFAIVGRVNLPILLWGADTCATTAVLEEYAAGSASVGLPGEAWGNLPRVTLTEQEEMFANSLSAHLGAGERSSLTVAIMRDAVFASDDLAARRYAKENNVKVTGTIGILVTCVREGHLNLQEANDLLTDMILAGYRSPVAVLNDLVNPSV